MIDDMRLTGLTRELAVNCAWLGQDGDLVRLALDPQYEKLHNPRHEQRLADALQERYGAARRLQIERQAAAAAQTPSARQAAAARERQLKAEQAIESDATVRALRDAFGASIEDVSAR
jgi:DNA polymerase-3 subunit gamma/tau